MSAKQNQFRIPNLERFKYHVDFFRFFAVNVGSMHKEITKLKFLYLLLLKNVHLSNGKHKLAAKRTFPLPDPKS